MNINESLKRTVHSFEAVMNGEILGRIVVEENTVLLCEVDSNKLLFEITDQHKIRVINGDEYISFTRSNILTKRDEFGTFILAGQKALVK